jgi:hypothetical protein
LKTAKQRRTVGYFVEHKFEPKEVRDKLKEYGIRRGHYSKIIVSWGWDAEAQRVALRRKLVLWDFRDLLDEIAQTIKHTRTYFTDDTMRTLQLFAKSADQAKRR